MVTSPFFLSASRLVIPRPQFWANSLPEGDGWDHSVVFNVITIFLLPVDLGCLVKDSPAALRWATALAGQGAWHWAAVGMQRARNPSILRLLAIHLRGRSAEVRPSFK